MQKISSLFSVLLFICISLSAQLADAQSKSITPGKFVSPFGIKQSTGTAKIVKPLLQVLSKLGPNDKAFEILRNVNYSQVRFLSKSSITVGNFFGELTSDLGISETDKFNLLKTEKDAIGFTHYRYQQTYKGIPVKGGEYLLHEKMGLLKSANGSFYSGLSIQTLPSISKAQAIKNAITNVGAKRYAWETPKLEIAQKDSKGEMNISDYPVAELIIAPIKGIYKKENFRLCYKININAADPYEIYDVFVDAQTGEVLDRISKIASSDVPGTASTLYSGPKAITTDSYSGTYRLRESGRPIQTFNMNNGTNYANAVDFTNSTTTWNTQEINLSNVTIEAVNNNWEDVLGEKLSNGGAPDIYIQIKDASNNVIFSKNDAYFENTFPLIIVDTKGLLLSNGPYILNIYDYDVTSSDDLLGSFSFNAVEGIGAFSANGTSGSISRTARNNPALDAHWAMEKTYDFYLSQLGRNSFDNAGSTIKNYVHMDNAFNNAFWNGTCMSYGDGDGLLLSPLTSMDVVGHEYTHAVVNYTADLEYQGESGALNESFADIMGTAIEFYGAATPNWTMGENIVLIPPYFMRSMSNPNSAPVEFGQQPDTYEGTFWVNPTSTQDNGGVHTNSGVQNYWFYLLSQGGTGTNDLGHAYTVTGIGINQATQIAYRNLAYNLASNSDYMSSYFGSLQAAEELYGANSAQQNAVREAWFAVGVGNNAAGQCAGTTMFTDASGSFEDGSGSANYQDNLDCMWLIQPNGANTIALNFSAFNTEAGYDSVMVYDGPSTNAPLLMVWWGNTLPPTITSTSGALLVRFMSDNEVNAVGWSAAYTSSGNAYCNGETLLTSSFGNFNDGSGGANYGNNQECYWLIAPPCANSVTLSFSAFNTELGFDGVIVFDGNNTNAPILLNTSGTTLPSSVTSTGGEMLVLFLSDYSTTMQGFTASYSSSGTPYCSGTTILNTSDWGEIEDGSGTNDYCNNMDCSWLIQPPQATSVTFLFSEIDIEPVSPDGFTIYDAVDFYDGANTSAPLLGSFSGSALPPSITSTSGSMYIHFHSDISVTLPGWLGTYTSTTTNFCTGTTSLTSSSGTFSDGSGSNLYGNGSDCKWLIHPANALSVTLKFNAFDTELNYDGVIVYDGDNTNAPQLGIFSGSTIPSSITSTGGSMLVNFLSDESERKNGWTANYYSVITGINNVEIPENIVSLYPNPFTNKLAVEFNLLKESDVEITIANVLGVTVKHFTPEILKGSFKKEIEMSDLPASTYLIKVLINGEQKVFKALKIQ